MNNTDYYNILGVSDKATLQEIKTAFRNLVKIHHPDKNPDKNTSEKFRQIQQAYETLSNRIKRQKYDATIFSSSPVSNTSTQKRKRYTYTESELKHRKQFNEEYKKYKAKKNGHRKKQSLVSEYNDTKYILYAIPIAVALLFMVINRNEKKAPDLLNEKEKYLHETGIKKQSSSADSLQIYHPGSPQLDSIENRLK